VLRKNLLLGDTQIVAHTTQLTQENNHLS